MENLSGGEKAIWGEYYFLALGGGGGGGGVWGGGGHLRFNSVRPKAVKRWN